MDAIKVCHLTKKYKEHAAVNDISFQVEDGEFFAFLGENGAGKSTTINILCTILKKTAGDITVFGNTLGRDDDAIRDSIGIVFQNSVLDPKLTVKENLLTRGSYYGLTKKETEQRLGEFWQPFELEEIWNRRYEKLSGGQRRRVDIIRALLHRPRILFLDEPTTGLDPKSRRIVWDYIDFLRKERGMTIFLTTHYMEETKDADHVVILDQGKIIADGTPVSLKNEFSFSRLVWYTKETEACGLLLDGYHHVYDTDHYNVYFTGTVTDFLYAHRDMIDDYEIIKGTMDDVFLRLTGKGFLE